MSQLTATSGKWRVRYLRLDASEARPFIYLYFRRRSVELGVALQRFQAVLLVLTNKANT
jgi:hypothetical protein